MTHNVGKKTICYRLHFGCIIKKKQEVQTGLGGVLGTGWNVRTEHQGWKHCQEMQAVLLNLSEAPATEARKAEGMYSKYQGHQALQ